VKSIVEVDNVLEDALLPSNIEKPGTDCMVISDIKISYEKLNEAFLFFYLDFVPKSISQR